MLGTVTASIDLANDITQAPIDNTTMIMDLVGVKLLSKAINDYNNTI